MLNFALRLVLYTLLTISVFWGSVLLAGPTVIMYLANNAFGQKLLIHNLKITPQLVLVASRVEFFDVEMLPNIVGNGSVRAVELNWKFLGKLKPQFTLSTGPMYFEDSVGYKEANLIANSSKLWDLNNIDFNFYINDLMFQEGSRIGNIKIDGRFDLEQMELEDMNFSGGDVELFSNLKLESSSLRGSLKNTRLNRKNEIALINEFTLELADLRAVGEGAILNQVVAKYNFQNGSGDLDVKIAHIFENKKRSDTEKHNIASDVKISASVNSFDLMGWEKVTIQSEQIRFPQSKHYEYGGGVSKFSALIENFSDGVYFSSNGTFNNLQLINSDGYLVNLSGSSFGFEAKHSNQSRDTGSLISKLQIETDTVPTAVLRGEAVLKLSQTDYTECLFSDNCIAEIRSEYSLEIEDNKLVGSSICSASDCYGGSFNHLFKSENTAKLFDGAVRSKIFNPFLLAFIYSNLAQGQKVGEGHILEF